MFQDNSADEWQPVGGDAYSDDNSYPPPQG